MKYVKLFIQNNISKIDILYTYKIKKEENIQLGMRVKVPFGRGNNPKIGIVVEILEENIENFKIKEIIEVLDYEPILSKELIELGFFMKEKYLTTFNQAFLPLMPPGDLKTIVKTVEFDENYKTNNEDEKELFEKLKVDNIVENLDLKSKELLQNLIENKVLKVKFKVVTTGGFKTQKMVKLTKDYKDKLEKYKINEKQTQVIKYLEDLDNSKRSDILKDLSISDSPIKTLEKNKIVEIYDEIVERNPYDEEFHTENHILNEEQKNAVNGILNSKKTVSLLHGLTGSGKTEVYLKLAEEVLNKGAQVIVLVPEIGLTPQMIERFKGRFKDRVSVLHSKLSAGERFDQWQKIKNNEVDIVVGARSAVFAPFTNLKMIIIDEEHDSSYRFHSALRYDTKEVAIKRMNNLKGNVVLGSATPDVISYYNAKNDKYNLFELKSRAVKGASLPSIEIVDMREELAMGNMSIFSENLRALIENRLNNEEQIILFLNRRGFSSFVSCRNCGHVIKCDNCDISMTYHRSNNILRCHYCGSTKKMLRVCPECGSKYIKQFGVGTQQVEEEIKKLFPSARVVRMDRDTTTAKDSYDNIYNSVKNREVDILIGTQMVAKGLDFENVTLVGVIAADLSLFISDFRANENTFELLTQVSGRAGRSNKDGNVVIQTYNPENYSIIFSKESDYLGFYEHELKIREVFKYPPFSSLVSIYFKSNSEKYLDNISRKVLFEITREIKNFKAEATNIVAVPRIKNVYKVKFTLKVNPEDLAKLTNIIKRVLVSNGKIFEKYKIYSDIEFL
ncbi:primosomal protein N' [Peptoniphilus stercorisuis]|uniref:Replication restart protein PriA n=1 Tax=Peptoniphilus stercorisuis TaxID=1436965 RepID=A0ABS4KFA4_9FIRM|nr:primosomal protein N' [Peptoniphilus stercorisuis]MBP2025846.1 primosomal protein N' (replication factor Y) [Peptoniphilus stercorisuis]